MDGWMDEWMDTMYMNDTRQIRWMNEWIDGRKDPNGWMDGLFEGIVQIE